MQEKILPIAKIRLKAITYKWCAVSNALDLTLPDQRQHAIRRSTGVSIAVNLVLSVLQLLVGWLAHSQALIADGLHTLSDLVADGVVLLASHEAGKGADDGHPYGHGRFENFASLVLGGLLLTVGIGMAWSAVGKLQQPGQIGAVHQAALYLALLALVGKELLFRYMLRVARLLKSSLLIANAWHARSDAASSLVVAVGVAGNLAGWPLFDALAALLVGLMIMRMGWQFSYAAFSDLTDRALDAATQGELRQALLQTPGVNGIHRLRSRRMGDQALLDVHLLVDPDLSVSEGHYIAERARQILLTRREVLDVLVHIDPEDDDLVASCTQLPGREVIEADLRPLLQLAGDNGKLSLHYLNGMLDAELRLPVTSRADALRLQQEAARLQPQLAYVRSIRLCWLQEAS